MSATSIDATNSSRIAAFGRRVLGGGEMAREEALWLFHLEDSADIFDLLAWANRIREHFKGNKIHLCSIVNIKAGGCSENCRFCSQSAAYQTDSPRYGLIEAEPVRVAAEEAQANGVTALGLVAAWRGLEEGAVLDDICSRLAELKRSGKARPDGSLGMIRSQAVADRLKEGWSATITISRVRGAFSRRSAPRTLTRSAFRRSATCNRPGSRFAPVESWEWAKLARIVATLPSR